MQQHDLHKAKDTIRLILTTNATGYTTDKRVNEIADLLKEAYNLGIQASADEARKFFPVDEFTLLKLKIK